MREAERADLSLCLSLSLPLHGSRLLCNEGACLKLVHLGEHERLEVSHTVMAFRIRVRHQLSGGRRRHGRHSSARSGACAAPVTWERSGECEERGGGRERERERTERQREKIERERGGGGGALVKN